MTWADYNQNGETVRLELTKSKIAKGDPIGVVKWSKRQIMQDHESAIEALHPIPEKLGILAYDVRIPKGHLAAMDFLGAKLSTNQREAARDAIQEIKMLIEQRQSDTLAQATTPDVCQAELGGILEKLRQSLVKHQGQDTEWRETFEDASARANDPRNIMVGSEICPGTAPLLLSALL